MLCGVAGERRVRHTCRGGAEPAQRLGRVVVAELLDADLPDDLLREVGREAPVRPGAGGDRGRVRLPRVRRVASRLLDPLALRGQRVGVDDDQRRVVQALLALEPAPREGQQRAALGACRVEQHLRRPVVQTDDELRRRRTARGEHQAPSTDEDKKQHSRHIGNTHRARV